MKNAERRTEVGGMVDPGGKGSRVGRSMTLLGLLSFRLSRLRGSSGSSG